MCRARRYTGSSTKSMRRRPPPSNGRARSLPRVRKGPTMLIDSDTHLREDYCLDKVYALTGEFAHLTPKRVGEGGYHQMKFEHSLSPWPAQAEKSHSHKSLYDPQRWEGRIARFQAESMDMDKRVAAFREIGVERQILFGTNMDPAVLTPGPL